MSITVSASGPAGFRTVVRALLSSLPRTFAAADPQQRGAVTIVDGAGEWVAAARLAISEGTTGILVIEPRPVPSVDVLALAEEAAVQRASVRLGRQWAGDPAVAALRAVPAPDGETTLIDSTAVTAPGEVLAHVLTAQVDLVRTVVGGDVRIESLIPVTDGYIASGRRRLGGESAPLLLAGARAAVGGPRAIVRELSHRGRRSVAVADGTIARASLARVGSDAGELALPPINETAYRVALRALGTDAAAGQPSTQDLASYAATLEVTAEWAGVVT